MQMNRGRPSTSFLKEQAIKFEKDNNFLKEELERKRIENDNLQRKHEELQEAFKFFLVDNSEDVIKLKKIIEEKDALLIFQTDNHISTRNKDILENEIKQCKMIIDDIRKITECKDNDGVKIVESVENLKKLLKNSEIRNKQLYSELQNHGWRKKSSKRRTSISKAMGENSVREKAIE